MFFFLLLIGSLFALKLSEELDLLRDVIWPALGPPQARNFSCGVNNVFCDSPPTHVLQLGWESLELSGTVPSEIALLTWLSDLSLGTNDLRSTLPVEIETMPNLTQLNVFGNRLLTGPLRWPPSLVSLIAVQCAFTGPLPANPALYANFQTFVVCQNYLEGSLEPLLAFNPSIISTCLVFCEAQPHECNDFECAFHAQLPVVCQWSSCPPQVTSTAFNCTTPPPNQNATGPPTPPTTSTTTSAPTTAGNGTETTSTSAALQDSSGQDAFDIGSIGFYAVIAVGVTLGVVVVAVLVVLLLRRRERRQVQVRSIQSSKHSSRRASSLPPGSRRVSSVHGQGSRRTSGVARHQYQSVDTAPRATPMYALAPVAVSQYSPAEPMGGGGTAGTGGTYSFYGPAPTQSTGGAGTAESIYTRPEPQMLR